MLPVVSPMETPAPKDAQLPGRSGTARLRFFASKKSNLASFSSNRVQSLVMRMKPRFLIGGALVVAAVAYLIISAVRNTAEYYMTVNEVQAHGGELKGRALRVAGRVKPGSVGWDPASLTLRFAIGPLPDADGASVKAAARSSDPSFRVVCKGQPKPDMFAENRDVIVQGRLAPDGTVAATQVLTSCPSKYAPKKPD